MVNQPDAQSNTPFDDNYLNKLYNTHVGSGLTPPTWHTSLMRKLRDEMRECIDKVERQLAWSNEGWQTQTDYSADLEDQVDDLKAQLLAGLREEKEQKDDSI